MTSLGFRTAKRTAGPVSSANLLWHEAGQVRHRASKGRTVAQNAGLRFEAKVCRELYKECEGFVAQVPFHYHSAGRNSKCILDGVVFYDPRLAKDTICLVEVKHRFTGEGWTELRHLYFPVVKRALPGKSIKLLEVCKVYEPGVQLPEPYRLWPTLTDFFNSSDSFGVLCWR